MRWSAGGAILSVLSCVVAGAAQEADPGVQEAVRRLEAAARAGDAAKFADEFAEPVGPLIREFLAVAAKADAAGKRLIAAADAKFGAFGGRNDPLFVGPGVRFVDGLRRTRSIAIEKAEPDGPAVKLAVKVYEQDEAAAAGTLKVRVEHWVATKAGERWKLSPREADKAAERMKKQIAALGRLPEAVDNIAGQVSAGKFKSREDASTALSKAMLKALGMERE